MTKDDEFEWETCNLPSAPAIHTLQEVQDEVDRLLADHGVTALVVSTAEGYSLRVIEIKPRRDDDDE